MLGQVPVLTNMYVYKTCITYGKCGMSKRFIVKSPTVISAEVNHCT